MSSPSFSYSGNIIKRYLLLTQCDDKDECREEEEEKKVFCIQYIAKILINNVRTKRTSFGSTHFDFRGLGRFDDFFAFAWWLGSVEGVSPVLSITRKGRKIHTEKRPCTGKIFSEETQKTPNSEEIYSSSLGYRSDQFHCCCLLSPTDQRESFVRRHVHFHDTWADHFRSARDFRIFFQVLFAPKDEKERSRDEPIEAHLRYIDQ